MFLQFLVISTIVCVGFADPVCKSCKEAVNNVFSMASSVMAGVEPLELDDVQTCKTLVVTGLRTIESRGTPCIKQNTQTHFTQQLTVGFSQLNITCKLKSLQETLSAVGGKLPFPLPKLPSIPFMGNSKKSPQRDILATWNEAEVELVMELDFENDMYNISKAKVNGMKLGALKLWCEGDGFMMKSCQYITKPTAIRNVFGLLVQFTVKQVVGIVLKNPSISDLLTALNCGEPDDE